MDREISKEVQRKEQRKQFIRIGTAVGGFIVLIVVVISMLQTRNHQFTDQLSYCGGV